MYTWLLTIFLLVPCLRCDPISTKDVVRKVASRQASISDIWRQYFHGSFVLDNKLYIDGGDATLSGLREIIFNQSTMVVDISSSFQTDKRSSNPLPNGQLISKGNAPTFDGPSYWVDETSKTAYAFGGGVSVLRPWTGISSVPLEELWAISPDQSWHTIDQTKNAGFNNLTRPFGGAYTSGKIGGFWLGGYYSRYTSQKTNTVDNFPNPGLVFFNYTDKSWSNFSTAGFYDGTFVGSPGGMQYVPSYGKSGILVVIAGQTMKPLPWLGTSYYGSNVSVFDVASKTWYSQPATGDIPKNAMRFCNVGASSTPGLNGTYEIFMYGGIMEDTTNVVGDDLYILSLPAFHWHKVNVTSGDFRAFHTCNVAGQRHMLSVGGLDPTVAQLSNLSLRTQDPYAYGIKIFDMTALNWTNNFNPSATYDTPQLIKDFYSTNPRYPTTWISSDLQNIFIASVHQQKFHLSTSLIVGIVLSATAITVIVSVLIWRIQSVRRVNRVNEATYVEKDATESPGSSTYHTELGIDPRGSFHRCGKVELGPGSFADAGKQELQGTLQAHELDGYVQPPRYELDQGTPRSAGSSELSPVSATVVSAGSERTFVSPGTTGYGYGDRYTLRPGGRGGSTVNYSRGGVVVQTREIEFKGGWI